MSGFVVARLRADAPLGATFFTGTMTVVETERFPVAVADSSFFIGEAMQFRLWISASSVAERLNGWGPSDHPRHRWCVRCLEDFRLDEAAA